jgi:hypothetical protein
MADSDEDFIDRMSDENAREEALLASLQPASVAPPVPDLVDLFVPGGSAFVWLRWSLCGDAWDLDLRSASIAMIGTATEWLSDELSHDGFDGIIHTPWLHIELPDGIEFNVGGLHLAASLGLAPGQPFLVEIEPPRSYRTSYEYDEWDVEWTWEIVRRIPWSTEQAGRSWLRTMEQVERRRERHVRRTLAERELRRTDVAAMYIHRDVYWPNGQSEWTAPKGIIARLTSRRGHAWMVEGRDDQGRWEWAREAMIANARKKLPHLSEETLRGLRVER